MKCIFCNDEITNENSSVEHIIPKFLGGKRAITNVCKSCNNSIGGDFESVLSNDKLMSIVLSYYKMRLRSGVYILPKFTFKNDDYTYTFKSDKKGGIYLYSYVAEKITNHGFTVLIDTSESESSREKIINKKIKKWNKKFGTEIPFYNDNTKEKFHTYENHGLDKPAQFDFEFESHYLNKLFIKIAYEFVRSCLGSKYTFDDELESLKDTLKLDKTDFNKFLDNNKENFQYDINTQKIFDCYYNVVESAKLNKTLMQYNLPLIHPSNGEYLHRILLFNNKGYLILFIDLFGIFSCKIIVSENSKEYNFKEGKIAELNVGIKNNIHLNEFNSDYEYIKSNFNI